MALAPGARLGPYEILAPLGAGGMGEVFRARDTRLGRDVAIKVLPDHFADDPKALHRFESEAKAVAALSHPNILFLLDVGETNGVHYAVTELLEGETLRALVARGPVPVKRALEIAHHVADALATAHDMGIIHRNVKPENVFLTRDGHVKLLDFGLARQENAFRDPDDSHTPTVSARTEAGAVVGTVAYMSPEQARGLPVDHRTDQFSLGVTLYEMLAGRRPFRGETGADVLAAILTLEPDALESVAPPVSLPVRLIVDRCLSKEPRERYASTRDLARDLASWQEHSSTAPVSEAPISAPAVTLPAAGRSPAARRRLFAALAAGALVLATSVGTWLLRGRGGSDKAPVKATSGPLAPGTLVLDPKRVAVASFENRTGDPSLDPVGRMAAEWITQGIFGLHIDVVPSADVFDAARTQSADGRPVHRETVRALADRTRAGIVVSGAYYQSGGDLRIQAQVSEVATGRLIQALEPATAPRADPMSAIDAIRHQVRGAVAVRVGDEVDGFLEGEERPPKYEAYAEYLLGEESFGIDYESAEAHYRKALEIDPDFVMPRIVLASSFRNRSRWEEAAAEIAVLERRRSSLTRYYRAILDMWREQLAGRTEESLAGVREFARLAPGDVIAQLDVAAFALLANRPREAEEACRAPAAWDLLFTPARPWGATWFRVHGTSLHALGRHEEELASVRKGRSIYPTRSELLRAEVRSLVPLGRYGEVDRLVEKGLDRAGAGEPPEALLLEAAAELRGHGHPDDARRMADRAASRLIERPEEQRSREECETLVHALLGAERWQEALPFLAKLQEERPGEDVTWMGLRAVAAQRNGDGALAARFDETLRRLDRPYLFGRNIFARAGLAAHRGEKEKAVGLFRQALAQGYFSEDAGASFFAHRALELAPLLGYPPFEELVKPKG